MTNDTMNPHDLLTTAEAAHLLRTPPGTLRYWRHLGTGPRSARIGRKIVYRRGDLDAWVAEQYEQHARGGTIAQQNAA